MCVCTLVCAHGFLCLLGEEGEVVRDTVFKFFIFNGLSELFGSDHVYLTLSAEFKMRFSLLSPRLFISLKNVKPETDAHRTLPSTRFTCPQLLHSGLTSVLQTW